ncbi:hypothetical protein OE749_00070 [Aestuariibacter sp. AA17]|uniref:DUF8198 domain-containing protein n=1 Tax=Fluctibacter corallii TaxID=2984329 RepID=A0ABT3A3H7_9ALTE|nr:hypothetical protein [Aestuariibacter sp. AA17]MCV2883089.1 hypothetical protein [Aestuariibacter sp. AA17]
MTRTLDKIVHHLHEANALQNVINQSPLQSKLVDVQKWQCHRLIDTHQPFWEDKRYSPAMQFFVNELYGPQDFSQRDEELARVVPKMSTLLPEKALASLETALHLNTMSLALDWKLTQHLGEQTINRDTYAHAYRACNNEKDRLLQLQFIAELGLALQEVIKVPGISTLLTLSKRPAKAAGVLTLHRFLHEGYRSFKKLGNVKDFIGPVLAKEHAIMEHLFHETTNPLPEVAF